MTLIRSTIGLAAAALLIGQAAPVLAQPAPDQPAAPSGSPATPNAAAASQAPSGAPASPTPPPAPNAPTNPAPPAVAGQIPPPPDGKGQVVFFRPMALGGMALSFSVHEDKKGLAKVGVGSYTVVPMDPGKHTFTVQSEAKDSLTLEVDAGETYYVEQSIGMGLLVGRPHLAPSTQGAFESHHSLKPSKQSPTDM
jgi:Protein of unknown function (DUF2846)